jgi:polygalacturonase
MTTINVLTFGADPSGKNDSTAAFRAALQELVELDPLDFLDSDARSTNDRTPAAQSALLVPAGTYKLSGFIWGKEEAEPTEPEGGASRDGCGSEPVGWCDT